MPEALVGQGLSGEQQLMGLKERAKFQGQPPGAHKPRNKAKFQWTIAQIADEPFAFLTGDFAAVGIVPSSS